MRCGRDSGSYAPTAHPGHATRCPVASQDLACDWRRLDERVEGLSNEIETIARQDTTCERLISVPGLGRSSPAGPRPPSAQARRSPRAAISPPARAVPRRSRPGTYHPRRDQAIATWGFRSCRGGRADQARRSGSTTGSSPGSRRPGSGCISGDRMEHPGPWPSIRGAEDRSGSEPIRSIPILRQRQQRRVVGRVIPDLKSGHCTSGHCASGQLSLTWFLSLDGWVPMSLLHPVHQPPSGLGTSPQSVHQPPPHGLSLSTDWGRPAF